MSLPYTWRPYGADESRIDLLILDDLIAHEHHVYRIIAIERDQRDPRRPWTMSMVDIDTGGHLVSYAVDTATVWRYPCGVVPACDHCGEAEPCREASINDVVAAEVDFAARFETTGICPACRQAVTNDQSHVRFEENHYVPLGSPVTIHDRRSCSGYLHHYDQLMIARGHKSQLTTDH